MKGNKIFDFSRKGFQDIINIMTRKINECVDISNGLIPTLEEYMTKVDWNKIINSDLYQNVLGELDKTNEQLDNITHFVSSFEGDNDHDRLVNALKSNLTVSGGVDKTLKLKKGESIVNSPISLLKNTKLIGENGCTELVYINDNNVDNIIKFENVEFDNVCIVPYGFSGNIHIKNCIFKNCEYSSLFFKCNDTNIYIENSTFINVKPNKSEWLSNSGSVQFWRYNPINIYGNNINLFVKNCRFENIMAEHIVYVVRDKKNIYMEFENNYVDTLEGNGLCFESSVSGLIKNNTFKNVGALRGAYGDRTNNGVGTNAIFSLDIFCDLVIDNNYIINVAENGIEGRYKQITNNYIENTGYRISENYATPSTEGIWGSAEIISNNTIINPYQDGIVIEDFGRFTSVVNCNNNTIINKKNDININNGIKIVCNSNDYKNVNIIDNFIYKFNSKYYILNPQNIKLENINIYDNSEVYSSCNMLLKETMDKLNGVSVLSSHSQELNFIDKSFKNWTDETTSVNWKKSNCSLIKVVENDNIHLKLVANDDNGRVYQPIILDDDVYVITLKVKSRITNNTNNGKFFVKIQCKNDLDKNVPNSNGAVWSVYPITVYGGVDEFKENVLTFKATQNTFIYIWAENGGDIIELKNITGFATKDN